MGMLSLNIPQYLCVYEVNNANHLILLQARDADTAELFTLLKTMEESFDFTMGKILDVSKVDPTHHISLTIH